MPPFEEVWTQFLTLGRRLRAAAQDLATAASPGRRWKGASGTVIMKDLWVHSDLKKLTDGCDAYLYLWLQNATKTHNAAVVEAMGSMWDAAARDVRHLVLRPATEEAVIAWSAPQAWHPEAHTFCTRALNRHFGVFRDGPNRGKQRPWNFHHTDERGRVVQQGGLVVGRHHLDPLRLPSWAYA